MNNITPLYGLAVVDKPKDYLIFIPCIASLLSIPRVIRDPIRPAVQEDTNLLPACSIVVVDVDVDVDVDVAA